MLKKQSVSAVVSETIDHMTEQYRELEIHNRQNIGRMLK